MSEAVFASAIAAVLQWEGGYVNDPDDSGGETNFGITKRSYPNLDIRRLTRDQAITIYHHDFWLANGYAELPDPIGAKMLDLAVNMGARGAGRCLQRACNHSGTAAPQLAIDGVVGPATRAVVGSIDPIRLRATLRTEAANYYRSIVDAHPWQAKFLRGWLRRAAS